MTKLTIVVAMDSKGGIGKDNKLPWDVPEDMRHFKFITTYGTVIMGRKTFDSIGKALPNRRNIVITRQLDWTREGVEVVHSLNEAIALVGNGSSKMLDEAFIIGGAEIYNEALPLVEHIEMTLITGDFDCDAFFPELFTKDWEGGLSTRLNTEISEHSKTPYTFLEMTRKKPVL